MTRQCNFARSNFIGISSSTSVKKTICFQIADTGINTKLAKRDHATGMFQVMAHKSTQADIEICDLITLVGGAALFISGFGARRVDIQRCAEHRIISRKPTHRRKDANIITGNFGSITAYLCHGNIRTSGIEQYTPHIGAGHLHTFFKLGFAGNGKQETERKQGKMFKSHIK